MSIIKFNIYIDDILVINSIGAFFIKNLYLYVHEYVMNKFISKVSK